VISRGVCAFALTMAASVPAQAQIYTWRDATGSLVLSNLPQEGSRSIKTYVVPRAEDVRTTRFVNDSRARTYDDLIVRHARSNNVRPSLVRAVIQVESGFNPSATSSKGAMGLMQLMPETARDLGVANPYNPAENVRGGTAYLRQLLDRYDNNEQLALAAY